MVSRSYFFLCSVFCLGLMTISATFEPAHAESPVEEPEIAVPEELAQAREMAQKTAEALRVLSAGLDKKQNEHLSLIYNNHTLIGTVEMVEGSIKGAVEQCGRDNPEMKEDMQAGFQAWQGGVEPVMEEAKGNLNNMIIAQDYAKESELRDILKMVSQSQKLSNNAIDKVPVTTPDACAKLLDTMEDTQERMVELLDRTLVSFTKAFPDSE